MTLSVRAVADAQLERDPDADIGRAILMGARGIGRHPSRSSSPAPCGSSRRARSTRPGSHACSEARATPATRRCGTAGGTILTVARALAERAEAIAGDGQAVEDALADVFVAGEKALEETTEQLDILKQAGVVDAGGAV